MKRVTALFTALALVLGLYACSTKVEEPIWQEQYDLGIRYLSEGEYEEAVLALTASIRIDPKQAGTYEKLADAYLALGDVEIALETLRDGYAATGDARLEARIDELAAPEPMPTLTPESTPAPTPEPTPEPTSTPEPTPEPTPERTPPSTPEPTLELDPDFVIENGVLVKYTGSGGVVTIPDAVTSIGDSAFLNCSSLTSVTIPDAVTSIGDSAFSDCSSLTSVTIPAGVTSIGRLSFWKCSSMTSIDVDPANKVFSSVDGVLFNKNRTTLIAYPIGKRVKKYDIPSGVTKIDSVAFNFCKELTSIIIPGSVNDMGASAFASCTGLTDVTIQDGVTSIGYYAFEYCDRLAVVYIPNSVISIEENAFSVCPNLSDIFYAGTEKQWAAIRIGNFNEDMEAATIHFNS